MIFSELFLAPYNCMKSVFSAKRYEIIFKQYGKTKFNTLEISCNKKLVLETQKKY